MLRCPGCGRQGGPFWLRHQVHADGRLLRAWMCPCRQRFHVAAGAERTPIVQANYIGFTVDHQGQLHQVTLKEIRHRETEWTVAGMVICVASLRLSTKSVTLSAAGAIDAPGMTVRLPGAGTRPDIAMGLHTCDLSIWAADLLAAVLYRIWH